MGYFFGSMYCWFEDLFGIDLANYLWGQATELQTTNMFMSIGLWMLAISLGFSIIYYYVWNPSKSYWWKWLIFLCVNAAINFIFGWQRTLSDYYADLMKYSVVKNGKEIWLNLNISDVDCVSFGVANMILSIMWFFLISCAIKWWSCGNSHCPF